MLMKKKTNLELYFLFIFIFCTGMKENQGLKEVNKGLDWLVSLIYMFIHGVHDNTHDTFPSLFFKKIK